jgi:hypothetical protein
MNNGAPFGPGSHASHEAGKPSSPSDSIPSADWLVALLADYSKISAAEFHARYPSFLAEREEVIEQGWEGWEATLRVIIGYAQAIESRRAETHSGSVHESAVPQGCAQTPSPLSSRTEG